MASLVALVGEITTQSLSKLRKTLSICINREIEIEITEYKTKYNHQQVAFMGQVEDFTFCKQCH